MHATDVETGEREVAALRGFAAGPALARLERLLSDSRTERHRVLERFAADDRLPKLKWLIAEDREQKARFNLFKVLGLAPEEERHSKILGWLFNPKENHAIGEAFLTRFLTETTAEAGKRGIASAVVPTAGWETTGVQLEWRNWAKRRKGAKGEWGSLDILIVNRQERFLCAIENKIWSGEHSEQLTRYRRALEAAYPYYSRHLVFLSPRGVAPRRAEERNFWTPVSYSTVLRVLDRTIESETMPPDVSAFLRQYTITMRKDIVPDNNSEIDRLARQIYLEHREAIELIYRNRPDWAAEAKQILKETVAQQEGWAIDREDTDAVGFRPVEWDRFRSIRTGAVYPQSPTLLLFQFKFARGGAGPPYLELSLSPSIDKAAREKLFEAVCQNPVPFHPTSTALRPGRLILHQEPRYILDDSDRGIGWDDGSVRAKIETWVADFIKSRFPAMNEVIVNCLEEYKAKQDGRAEPG